MRLGATRRGFLTRAAAAALAVLTERVGSLLAGRPLVRPASAQAGARGRPQVRAGVTHGPFLGDLAPSGVRVWARCADPGPHRLVVRRREGGEEIFAVAEATTDGDRTVVWRVSGLEPSTRYDYEVRSGERSLFSSPDASFVTPPPPA